MKKKDIKILETWERDIDNKYDFIYIIPTREKFWDYFWAWYIWRIWDTYKKIDFYDCWSIKDMKSSYNVINFDFEDIFWWVKLWTNNWKLRYTYWWCIEAISK